MESSSKLTSNMTPTPDYTVKVQNMINILFENDMIDKYLNFEPSIQNGYVYDTSDVIELLKKNTKDDNHSDASFAVCCNILKKKLESDL